MKKYIKNNNALEPQDEYINTTHDDLSFENDGIYYNGTKIVNTANEVESAEIGEIKPTYATITDGSWLLCDGTTYNVDDYPELAALIDSTSTTTFSVPDCRNRYPVMVGSSSVLTSNNDVFTLGETKSANNTHSHNSNSYTHNHSGTSTHSHKMSAGNGKMYMGEFSSTSGSSTTGTLSTVLLSATWSNSTTTLTSNTVTPTYTIGSVGSGVFQPKTVCLNYYIKAR